MFKQYVQMRSWPSYTVVDVYVQDNEILQIASFVLNNTEIKIIHNFNSSYRVLKNYSLRPFQIDIFGVF